jgi:hypothetical protein
MNFKGTLPTLILESLAQGPSHGLAKDRAEWRAISQAVTVILGEA